MANNGFARLGERAVNVKQAAEITGYSVGYIYHLVSKRQIPFHKRGGANGKGAVRFFAGELVDWMNKGWGCSPAADDLNERADEILAMNALAGTAR